MTTPRAPDDIPLFPLHAVLFPSAELALRIFERRYLDMVRDCARAGSGFGVCLILEGREVGAPRRSPRRWARWRASSTSTPATMACSASAYSASNASG